MEQRYFSELLPSLASRANLGAISWLCYANVPLRRHLMEVFSRPFGDTGSFLADPTFEAVFGWTPAEMQMQHLAGNLLSSELVEVMNAPPPELMKEYRFAKDRTPYAHQLSAWTILSQRPAQSLIVTSGTGSGKTECFMVPILDCLAREQATIGGQLVGVRALFLYPLNALINSQRDRLRAWTHGFGNKIRFCLYNGMTPDSVPAGTITSAGSEVQDRKTLRSSPPPILVTNATMLEYMLVRTQDANILQASQGKLEWIVLDEAHTYIGSQAAELALLIRRVVNAFGVKSENVRFVATSATIGDPNGEAGEKLKEFIAQVAGVDLSHVHLVAGSRQIPSLPPSGPQAIQSFEELEAIEPNSETTPNRYKILTANPIAKKIRDLFIARKALPIARLTEVCSIIHGPAEGYSATQQLSSLRWLDILTSTIDKDGYPFLPLRGHIFHQTLSGLWCCADFNCPEKQGTHLEDPAWPFGQLFLAPRNHCTCGSPSYELLACNECGEIYLNAEERQGVISQVMSEAVDDEFELEDESEESDQQDIEEELSEDNSKHSLLITNRSLQHTGSLHIDRQTGRIVDAGVAKALEIIVFEDDGTGLGCPVCEAKGALDGKIFRKARIGAPYLLGGLLPTLLEFAPDGPQPVDRPYRGRQLLTFSDSRQGTARLAAKLQQDAERTKVRGLIYHHVLEKAQSGNTAGDEQLKADFELYKGILESPGIPDERRAPIAAKLEETQRLLAAVAQPVPMMFSELQAAIAQEGLEFRSILNTYQGYSRSVFSGHEGASHLSGLLLVRELGRRPKRQNNLETMGMVSVHYRRLNQINSAPIDWISRGYSMQDWKDFLKIALDYFVRGGGSLDIQDIWRNWLGVRFPRSWVVPPSQDVISKGQRRWPSARRSKLQSTLVRLMAYLLKAHIETPIGQDSVDNLLNAAWEDVKKVLTMTESGYILRLDELSFVPINQAWICPVTRRFLDTTLRGITPYLPRVMRNEIAVCEKVEIPIYDKPFGHTTDGLERIRRARAWLAEQSQVAKLREIGLWSTYSDRVIELAPYFSTAEHSAQQPSSLLDQYERKFKDGRINILSCSTTMEMGVDIGGVQLVAMNNVPPHPANYLQRAGRAGRRRETRSAAVTLCKSNPHDQNVFLNTGWAFEAKLPPPVVSLNSSVIVQRHINAMVLAQFLKDLLHNNPKDLSKLTCGWFFDNSDQGPARSFIAWCEAYVSTKHKHIDAGLKQLVKHSIFEGQASERLVHQSGFDLVEAYERWTGEWNALLEQENAFGSGAANDPAIKAIGFQKRRLADEYLLRELATQGFLPAYGFPTFIASFDNTTISAAQHLPSLNTLSNSAGRDDNRFMKRDFASRDLVTALREYAPGAEIVMDGLVYRSAGITLNWHIPATQQDANESQAIKFAWRCHSCGASGTTHSLLLAKRCDACGADVRSSEIQQFLEPAGFSVDFYVDPHNDISAQQFVSVQRPWISARGNWAPMPNPKLGRFRATTDGRVYHHSAGHHGEGYALCLSCGRAEPMQPGGSLPKIFEKGQEHKKLRSRKEDRTCSGSTNRWAIKDGIVLGHQVLTDVLELQLKDINAQWISDRTTALTLAVALRDSLAALIGVQANELGCDVQEMRTDDGAKCQSLFIFDRFAAGYASGAARLINALFRKTAERLDCPKGCDSACPHCVLDFDQRFESNSLNRHAALGVVTKEWLDQMKLPREMCYLGENSQAETADIISAVLRESGRTDAVLTRLYAGGEADLTEIASSNLRLLSYRLAALQRPVQIVIERSFLEGMSEENRFSLASLADHPHISIRLVSNLPKIADAYLIAEVAQGQASLAWATRNRQLLVLNSTWGKSSEPIVYGSYSQSAPIKYEEVSAVNIRPTVGDAGDCEIVLQHEIDGNIQGFGDRFWHVIRDNHKGTSTLFLDRYAEVKSIKYTDRYLFTPVSVALLVDLIAGLKEVLGEARWDNPEVLVTTTRVRGGPESRAYNTVYADWVDTKNRDEVVIESFNYIGLKCHLNVIDKFKTQHGRSLEIEFTNGKHITVRFDQGVSYWRVSSPAQSIKKFSTWFDFKDKDIEKQARSVAEMNLPVEGGIMPTEIFVKTRDSSNEGI